MRLRTLPDPDVLPAFDSRYALERPASHLAGGIGHPPRVLLLYGSLRQRSYSRLVVEEAARLLRFFGAEPRIFDPSDLPLPDQVRADDHPAVHELREHAIWSEGQIWGSPERHGQITGVMKAQIDHLPLNMGGLKSPVAAVAWTLSAGIGAEHVKPLDAGSAKQLRDLISHWYPLLPSGHARFANIARTRIDACEPDEVNLVREWLYERALPFQQQVFVLWDSHAAAITTWKMIVRYWDHFWYPSSDDVVVFDASLSWLLFLSHEEKAFFARVPQCSAP